MVKSILAFLVYGYGTQSLASSAPEGIVLGELEGASGYKTDFSSYLVDTPPLLPSVFSTVNDCQTVEFFSYKNVNKKEAAVVPSDDNFFVTPMTREINERDMSWLPRVSGSDRDRDCVRDDIENYIFKTYPSKSQFRLRKQLYDYAIWTNRFIGSNLSTSQAQSIFLNANNASQCVALVLGNRDLAGQITRTIFAKIHNTIGRSHLYFANLNQLAGWKSRSLLNPRCA